MSDQPRACPKCSKPLTEERPRPRLVRYRCEEHGLFRVRRPLSREALVERRIDRALNPNNWHATCEECGGKMDYFNLRYCCRKCGHVMEV